ncbi:MAG: HD domain-containing protein [Planctomycetia bacterium]|nr:HD domain-containing protein [Planctomycetia bacterium]
MIPEIAVLDARYNIIRIPSELDVPLTARVRRVLDTPEFQRLKHISQLGLVAQVYPGALHSRFEHSLGVYRLAVLLIKRMLYDKRFAEAISPADAEVFILSALLHDLGHYPFCHPVEDMFLPEVTSHEKGMIRYLRNESSEIFSCIKEDWSCTPEDVYMILCKDTSSLSRRLLSSMLSGPVDIDKMDYLYRDSLHAGVPYGRNFDQERLLGSLCLNAAGDGLAISSKGKTAAEMMVFARYVMFSEVYWHHAVRSATAMFQRLYYESRREMTSEERRDFHQKYMEVTDVEAIHMLREMRGRSDCPLWGGLFGKRRALYKQVAQYSVFEYPEVYRRFARLPYAELVEKAVCFAEKLSVRTGMVISPDDVILDAPPVEREVEFIVDVYSAKTGKYYPLGEVSPVIRALAQEQFDDVVKRVRLFLHPKWARVLSEVGMDLENLLMEL